MKRGTKLILGFLLVMGMFLMVSGVGYAQVPDADQDGVPDADDKCSNSLTGNVDTVGCSCEQKTFYSRREETQNTNIVIEETCASKYPNANQLGRAQGTGCCNRAPNTFCQVQNGQAACTSNRPANYGDTGGPYDFSFTRPGPNDNNLQWRIGEDQLISWNGPIGMTPNTGGGDTPQRIFYEVLLLNNQCGSRGCSLIPVMTIDTTEATSILWKVGQSCINQPDRYYGGGDGPDFYPAQRTCSSPNILPGQYWIRLQPHGFSNAYITTANPINIVAAGSQTPSLGGLEFVPHPPVIGQSLRIIYHNPIPGTHCAFRYRRCPPNPPTNVCDDVTASTTWQGPISGDCSERVIPIFNAEPGTYQVEAAACRSDGQCSQPYFRSGSITLAAPTVAPPPTGVPPAPTPPSGPGIPPLPTTPGSPGTAPTVSVPAPDPNADAVEYAFNLMLERGAGSSLEFWLDSLDRGVVTRREMLVSFYKSTEFQNTYNPNTKNPTEFVNFVYQKLLQRAPESPNVWQTVFTNNNNQDNKEAVVRGIVNSAEFKSKHPLFANGAECVDRSYIGPGIYRICSALGQTIATKLIFSDNKKLIVAGVQQGTAIINLKLLDNANNELAQVQNGQLPIGNQFALAPVQGTYSNIQDVS